MKFLFACILFAAVNFGVLDALCARLYQHYGYKGKVLKLYGDNNNFSKNKFNDMLSSYKVEPGCKLTLYQHSRYRGKSLPVTGNGGVPACCWNDIASSARCRCSCARLYQHHHFKGRQLNVGTFHPRFSLNNFNDVLSSYRVKRNCRLTIFQHSYYRGVRKTVQGKGNVPRWWNDKASSSICRCSTSYCARLYQHRNFKGRQLKVSKYHPRFSINNFNDLLSSYKVKRDCKLTIYEHALYKGARKTVKGQGNVSRWWNDKASSSKCFCYPKYCARLYQHFNFKGRLLKVGAKNSNFKKNKFNDMMSSFKVRSGCVLTIYQHTYYKGAKREYRGNGNVSRWWNDKASSSKCKCY